MYDLHESIGQLKKTSRQFQKLAKSLDRYLMTSEKAIENAYFLEKQCADIEKGVADLPDGALKRSLQEWLAAERSRIVEHKDEFKIQFGQKLQSLLSREHIAVKGQYPLLRAGFYTLKLDFEFGQAALFFGPEIEKIIPRIDLHPQAVVDALLSYDRELKALDHSTQEYLEQLARSYSRVVRLQGKDFGDRALLTDVLREFVLQQQSRKFFADPQRGHFTGFSRVRLAYILYQIKQAGVAEHGLHFHVATFDATTDRLQSFWIPESEHGEGTHYSHISFDQPPDRQAQ